MVTMIVLMVRMNCRSPLDRAQLVVILHVMAHVVCNLPKFVMVWLTALTSPMSHNVQIRRNPKTTSLRTIIVTTFIVKTGIAFRSINDVIQLTTAVIIPMKLIALRLIYQFLNSCQLKMIKTIPILKKSLTTKSLTLMNANRQIIIA